MKKLFCLIILTFIFQFAGAINILAADTFCSGNLGAVTIPGDLIVNESCQCALDGTVVKGSIIVSTGGRLVAEGARVSGDLQAVGAAQIQVLQGSWIGGNVSISQTAEAGSNIISDTQIRGNLELTQNTAEFEVKQNQIRANLRLEENSAKVVARANTISGNLVISGNTGGISVKENQIKGGLTCKDNDPAPRGGDNTVSGQIKGQCAAMEPDVVAMPDIVGLSQADAETAILGAYLNVGTVTTAYDSSVPLGHVISQTPSAGTMIEADTSVDFVVCFQSGPQVITFTSDPETIISGESGTLSWATQYADSVTIEPGIGAVPLNGSIAVSPTQTTTYTLTAAGTGTPAIKYVTVTVTPIPGPTATFSANPEAIIFGETSTLTWTTQYADSVIIEPDIGAVDLNGSIEVSPHQTMPYTLTATGLGGTTTKSVTLTVHSVISLTVTSPTSGSLVDRPDIMVRGTVSNMYGYETGVTVNGIPALIYGSQFAVNHVPLVSGENTVTIAGRDAKGNSTEMSINVTSEVTRPYVTLSIDQGVGCRPFESTMRLNSFFTVQTLSISDTGLGAIAYSAGSSPAEAGVQVSAEGMFFVTFQTSYSGQVFNDTIAILVYDQSTLDSLLRQKWEGMRAALLNNDLDSAVSDISAETKDSYREIFAAMSAEQRASLVNELSDIQFIKAMGSSVEYDIRTVRNGTPYSFYLLFEMDDYGRWKISRF